LHRYLHALGIANLVVDSASIEVSRCYKRVKTDMLDVDKLLLKFRPHKSGYDFPLTLQFIGRPRYQGNDVQFHRWFRLTDF